MGAKSVDSTAIVSVGAEDNIGSFHKTSQAEEDCCNRSVGEIMLEKPELFRVCVLSCT